VLTTLGKGMPKICTLTILVLTIIKTVSYPVVHSLRGLLALAANRVWKT
jgi:hypothetical protein